MEYESLLCPLALGLLKCCFADSVYQDQTARNVQSDLVYTLSETTRSCIGNKNSVIVIFRYVLFAGFPILTFDFLPDHKILALSKFKGLADDNFTCGSFHAVSRRVGRIYIVKNGEKR